MKISLVMATIGRVQEIREFMRSLASQSYKDYELIIVDQNPDDRLLTVLDFAAQLGIPCLHLHQAVPNLCQARNTGQMHAQGDIVAFPDDDCWYESDVLDKVVHRISEVDAPVGVVTRWAEQGLLNNVPHTISNKLWRRFQEIQASSITLFLNRQLLGNMQGFDTEFGLHSWYGSGEETDLMFRILASDNRIVYLPDALVHHPFHKLATQPFLKAFSNSRRRARGTGALYAKHKIDLWVILRGLLSPWFYAGLNILQPAIIGVELGKAIGRIEGYFCWLFSKRAI